MFYNWYPRTSLHRSSRAQIDSVNVNHMYTIEIRFCGSILMYSVGQIGHEAHTVIIIRASS
jgi:hypothetical protein